MMTVLLSRISLQKIPRLSFSSGLFKGHMFLILNRRLFFFFLLQWKQTDLTAQKTLIRARTHTRSKVAMSKCKARCLELQMVC